MPQSSEPGWLFPSGCALQRNGTVPPWPPPRKPECEPRRMNPQRELPTQAVTKLGDAGASRCENALAEARAFFMGFIQGEDRGQGTLFPVTLEELIPEDHRCYDPRDLLKLYLYGYLQQIRSSRRLRSSSSSRPFRCDEGPMFCFFFMAPPLCFPLRPCYRTSLTAKDHFPYTQD